MPLGIGRETKDQRKADRSIADFHEYERRKCAWLRKYPAATPEDVARAMRAIANELGL